MTQQFHFGYLSKENKNTNTKKGICTPLFIEALFSIAKIQKQPKYPPVDKWVRNMWHTHDRILFSHKKE